MIPRNHGNHKIKTISRDRCLKAQHSRQPRRDVTRADGVGALVWRGRSHEDDLQGNSKLTLEVHLEVQPKAGLALLTDNFTSHACGEFLQPIFRER